MADAIHMEGVPIGPFRLGRHMTPGPEWVWWDGQGHFCCGSRWRWLVVWKHKRRLGWAAERARASSKGDADA